MARPRRCSAIGSPDSRLFISFTKHNTPRAHFRYGAPLPGLRSNHLAGGDYVTPTAEHAATTLSRWAVVPRSRLIRTDSAVTRRRRGSARWAVMIAGDGLRPAVRRARGPVTGALGTTRLRYPRHSLTDSGLRLVGIALYLFGSLLEQKRRGRGPRFRQSHAHDVQLLASLLTSA